MTHNDDKKSSETDEKRSRKERVLHTRIPAVLEQELKNLAENLRVPVSNVVRTILQDAMEAVEAVGRVAEEELRGVADRVARERAKLNDVAAAAGADLGARVASSRAAPPPAEALAGQTGGPDPTTVLDGVLGFQELLLAVTATCALCERKLEVGAPAYLGVRGAPGPQIIIGPECLPGKKE
ncbi:MAG: hypothetical protein ABI333_12680 [bacterium]